MLRKGLTYFIFVMACSNFITTTTFAQDYRNVAAYPQKLDDISSKQLIELRNHVANTFGLNSCEIRSIPQQLDQNKLSINTQLGDNIQDLTLFRHSLRSGDFKLLVDDGSMNAVEPPPVLTYRGWVNQDPQSEVAASISQNGQLHAMILKQGSDTWYIDPISQALPGTPTDWHVVYRASDVIPTDTQCGADDSVALGQRIAEAVDQRTTESIAGTVGLTELAFDADVEFYQLNGSSVPNTVADIEMITNFIDLIYQAQVGICYTIPGIIVRTAEPDPYSSTDSSALLCEFTSLWGSTNPITHDVAHLMTGKEIDGSTIGVGWIGVICGQVFNLTNTCPGLTSRADYGLSESFFRSPFATALDLRINITAHELGHNWGACHCNQSSCTGGAADGDCQIMWSSILGVLTFGGRSASSIVAHRNSRACLGTCGGDPADCDGDGVPDEVEIVTGRALDCNNNGIPDDCETTDCNNNGIPDDCDIMAMTSSDCNTNTIPDECDVNLTSNDCNLNVIPDECEVAILDCNSNNIPDDCDIDSLRSANCNNNSIPDECENDCNCNGIDDVTDVAGVDCNSNISPDDCDIALGLSGDCDLNGVPDECESPNCIMSLDFAVINSSGIRSATPGRAAAYTLTSSSGHPIAGGESTSASYEQSNGFLVVTTSTAAEAPLALSGEPGFSKDRYVSFNATTNGTKAVAIRVTRVGSTSEKYVDCTSLVDKGADGFYAKLIDGPLPAPGDVTYYCDLSGVTTGLHVRGCTIVPGNLYDIAMTDNGTTFSLDLSVPTTPPQAPTREFGDVLGVFDGTIWTAPDGIVTTNDIVGVIKKFIFEPGAPIIARVDNTGAVPNSLVVSDDVLRSVLGFAGATFGSGVTNCLSGRCIPGCP